MKMEKLVSDSTEAEAVRNCEKHGEYIAKIINFDAVGICKRIEMSCPTCSEERQKEEAERERRINAENEAKRLEQRIGRAGIPKRFQQKTFDNFVADNPGKHRALNSMKRYAENFDEYKAQGKSLILNGKTGTGKTHLVNALANYLVSKKKNPIFITAFDLVGKIKSCWRDKTKSEDEVIGCFSGCDLLIIDEVGVQYESEAEKVIMFDIINKRYEDMLPTIIVSNYPIDDETGPSIRKTLGDRILDRLREGGGSTINFDWESNRKNNRIFGVQK